MKALIELYFQHEALPNNVFVLLSILSELRFLRKHKKNKKTKVVPLSQTVSENVDKLRKVFKSNQRMTFKKNRNAKF
jgi:hypothetical protein